jgi:hypothetical protein
MSSLSPLPSSLSALRSLKVALFVLGWLSPALALACPVCFVAREASRLAFLWTAILMTFLPLCMMGGIVYYLWRQVQRGAGASTSDAPADPSTLQ